MSVSILYLRSHRSRHVCCINTTYLSLSLNHLFICLFYFVILGFRYSSLVVVRVLVGSRSSRVYYWDQYYVRLSSGKPIGNVSVFTSVYTLFWSIWHGRGGCLVHPFPVPPPSLHFRPRILSPAGLKETRIITSTQDNGEFFSLFISSPDVQTLFPRLPSVIHDWNDRNMNFVQQWLIRHSGRRLIVENGCRRMNKKEIDRALFMTRPFFMIIDRHVYYFIFFNNHFYSWRFLCWISFKWWRNVYSANSNS